MILKRKNPFIPTVYYQNDKRKSMSDLAYLFRVFSSSDFNSKYELERLIATEKAATNDLLPTWIWDSNVSCYLTSKYGNLKKIVYSIYVETHKYDYYQYKIIFKESIAKRKVNTYITGTSKLCSINDFYTLLPNIRLTDNKPTGMKNEYSSEKEKELDYYRMINEHIYWFFSRFGGKFQEQS